MRSINTIEALLSHKSDTVGSCGDGCACGIKGFGVDSVA